MKISLEDWTRIDKYNHAAKWARPLCSYSLKVEPDGQYKREQYINWLVFILLYVPCCIIQTIWCMWDGGLKQFELPERYLGGDRFFPDSKSGQIAKEILERA